MMVVDEGRRGGCERIVGPCERRSRRFGLEQDLKIVRPILRGSGRGRVPTSEFGLPPQLCPTLVKFQ